jgi:predicted ATPase/DNA-binding SARP family transcriptional activator/Tfp pilus assembly protein PilF
MAAGEVRVLGPVEVVGDEGAVSLAGMQARLFAALLVADGRTSGTDELVEAIWADSAPASARKLVQVYVSQLRKVLPAEIEIDTRRGGYAASIAGRALDAVRFEQLLREAGDAREADNAALALSLADRALALWRGRAYGELAYEEFARAESERLEELRLGAVEERIAALLDLGRHDDVLGEALAHAQQNGLRERAHGLAMLALYRGGRQADALEHYAAFRARLDEELGLEPGPTLRELQRRILRQDPELDVAADGRADSALPVPPNPLVGRERELEALRALLDRREPRLVVLTGAGGSGKTRLALEVAREAAPSYANGVVLVELAPLRDPALVLPTIAQALDVAVDADEDLLDTLARALESQELLLVVDNAEHVRSAALVYAELVARAERLTLLVTSRAVLHVSGEQVVPVAPLAEDDAVELFTQRARLLDPSFELTSDNEPDVREICRRVDGLPLAVELAAARIRALTPRTLRQRLDERLSLLTGGPRDLPARQQTLRETIAWSVGLLDDRGRDVFARLAVFPAGATLEAAEQVCGADLDTLAALIDDHVIRRDDIEGEPRFGMLETVREYALELLGKECVAAAQAMALYLADVVDEVDLASRGVSPALSRLDPELDNVRAALAACVEVGDAELEVRLAGGMWRYCWVRGLGREGLRWIETALARGDGRASAARARALHGAGGLAWSVGDFERAVELAGAAIPVAQEVGATWDEMAANTVLGVATNSLGERERARTYHQRSLELSEELGIEPVVAMHNLASIAVDLGDNEEARRMFDDVLAIQRRNENVSGIGIALLNRGATNHALGHHAAARRDFEEAQACLAEVGFPAHVARTKQGLAACAASQGDFEEAARLMGRATRELEELGVPDGEFGVLMNAETVERAREALGDDAYGAAYAAGRESD